MHGMNLRQFTLHFHGDRSGEVKIRNEVTGEQMEVDSDVLFHFVAESIRACRISSLEQMSPAALLGLPQHPAFHNRRDCIESKKHKHVFWCAAGTVLDTGPTRHDGWHFWDEAGLHGGGPLQGEDVAASALEFYCDHVLNGPEDLQQHDGRTNP